MRKLSWIVVALMIAAGGLLMRGGFTRPASAAPTADDATQTARQFTPWLTALAHGKLQNASQFFQLRPSAQNELNTNETSQIMARLAQVENFQLNLVWSKSLGAGTGIAMFSIPTEDGPIGFKVYYYTFANQAYISHVIFSNHWSDIERMAFTIDPLTGPVATVPLNDQ